MSTYTILISVRALDGMREIGVFFLGADAGMAHGVFASLAGDETSEEDALIRIDLKKEDSRLNSINCTLDQYAENCKIITRDLFKFFTLEK